MSDRTLPAQEGPDLSLVLGGPLYQAYLRCRLTRAPMDLLTRRVLAFVLITWVPLAVLSVIEGRAFGGVTVPFIEHLGAHVRFLVVLPLLIAAEVIVHERITIAVREFTGRGLVAPEDRARFDNAIASALRLRNSVLVEVVLLVVAFTLGSWLWNQYLAIRSQTWYAPGPGGAPFTLAGYWYAFVSLPILRFLTVRWYFRLFIWYLFLWKVSRLPLRLNALHPDRAGGLGFLDITPFALVPVLLAQTVLLAGEIGDRIWHVGAKLPQFYIDIAILLVFLVLLAYVPLTFFIRRLDTTRWAGRREYGRFAAQYITDFREKWLKGTTGGESGSELGTGDIQSLADLANSFQVIRDMGLLPFATKSVLRLVLLLAVPLVPLVLTMIPVNELIERLIKLVL